MLPTPPAAPSTRRMSRRSFLKFGCLGAAAAGLAVCGLPLAAPIPGSDETELPSATFGENGMEKRILIAYASAFGSTAEVAAEIGQSLGAAGWAVDVRPVRENPSLDGCQAVLLGSAVQYGTWLPEALDFIKANQGQLSRLPVGVFCVHITSTGDDPQSRQKRLAFLDAARTLLQPVDEAYFAGKFDRRGAALLLPGWLSRLVPTMDHRKWDKIRSWAGQIGQRLSETMLQGER